MRFSGRFLSIAMILLAVACAKKSGSDSKGEPEQGPDNGGPGNTDTGTGNGTGSGTGTGTGSNMPQAGNLAIVDFNVLPISSAGLADDGASDIDAIAARNVNPAYAAGNLALAIPSAGLHGGMNLAQATMPTHGNPEQISAASPSYMKVFVTKIMLKKSSGNGVAVLLDAPNGAPIEFKDGVADLSGLAQAANTGETSLRLADEGETKDHVKLGVESTGEFDIVAVDYKAGAEIKGCVAAEWDNDMAGGSNVTPAFHTYCTRAGKSSFEATGNGFDMTDFSVAVDVNGEMINPEAEAPEIMKINLSRIWKDGTDLEGGRVTVEYPLDKPIKLETDVTSPMAMIVDMNRMLRFFRDYDGTSTGIMGSTVKGAMFFNSVWDESTRLVVGEPGRIYGFQVVSKACKTDKFTAPDNCNDGGNYFTIDGWLTVITGKEGQPMTSLLMPDNDDALVVVKGSSADFTKAGEPFIEAGSADDKVNIRYGMGKDGDCQTGGKILDFPADINGLSDENLVEVSFQANKCNNGALEDEYTGPMYLIRRL